MSGHNKWSSIKHKKAREDARRGKMFSKLIREIQVAARHGGGNPENNPRLRAVIEKAKAANMPQDNIIRAIKKGTGELSGAEAFEEVVYEGYGPQGVAVMVRALTDNKRRTAADVRHVFSKYGGSLGENGCVSWLFDEMGYIVFNKDEVDPDAVIEVALDAGALDTKEPEDDNILEVFTEVKDFETVKNAFEEAGLKYMNAEITLIPQTQIKLSGKAAEQMLKLMEALEDIDDVNSVCANFDISAEEMEKLAS